MEGEIDRLLKHPERAVAGTGQPPVFGPAAPLVRCYSKDFLNHARVKPLLPKGVEHVINFSEKFENIASQVNCNFGSNEITLP